MTFVQRTFVVKTGTDACVDIAAFHITGPVQRDAESVITLPLRAYFIVSSLTCFSCSFFEDLSVEIMYISYINAQTITTVRT